MPDDLGPAFAFVPCREDRSRVRAEVDAGGIPRIPGHRLSQNREITCALRQTLAQILPCVSTISRSPDRGGGIGRKAPGHVAVQRQRPDRLRIARMHADREPEGRRQARGDVVPTAPSVRRAPDPVMVLLIQQVRIARRAASCYARSAPSRHRAARPDGRDGHRLPHSTDGSGVPRSCRCLRSRRRPRPICRSTAFPNSQGRERSCAAPAPPHPGSIRWPKDGPSARRSFPRSHRHPNFAAGSRVSYRQTACRARRPATRSAGSRRRTAAVRRSSQSSWRSRRRCGPIHPVRPPSGA